MPDPYKFTFLLTILCATSFTLPARDVQVPALTEFSKVSMLTVGRASDEVWQNFGHTAIRIKDSILGWDLVYNYGTFTEDADRLVFIKKFLKCQLMYYESIDNFSDFEEMYVEENRWVREQPLNLTLQQRQELFEKLTINAREENKYYRYDFLFDNCSTRPRDVILSLFKDKKFAHHADDDATFRQLIDRNVGPWLGLGMDLLIGTPTDRKAQFKRTFLPLELMDLFDSARVDGKPLVTGNTLILDVVPEDKPKMWLTPRLVFWLMFFLILLLQIKTSIFSRWKILPVIYFTILGLLGWLFIFLWFFTDHSSTKGNLNILWAMPLNIPVIFFALKKKPPRWVLGYIKTYRILLIILLLSWWINPQHYNGAVVPIILTAVLFTSLFLPVPTTEDFRRRWFG